MSDAQIKKVLIVDDEEDIRNLIKASIQAVAENTQVIEASNGLEAFELINQHGSFDLMTSDLKMPKCSGEELLLKIRGLPPEKKPKNILMLSGNLTNRPLNVRSIAGATFISKPYDLDVFENYIKSTLNTGSETELTEKVDPVFLEHFIRSTIDTLKILTSSPISKEKVFVQSKLALDGDVSACMTFISKNEAHPFQGAFVLLFPKGTLLGVVNQMLGTEFTELSPDLFDAAGEIVNQVYGAAKMTLNKKDYGLPLAIPMVINNFEKSNTPRISLVGSFIGVLFKTNWGPLTIEIGIQKNTPETVGTPKAA